MANELRITHITLDFGAIFHHCSLHKEVVQQSVLISAHKVFFHPSL